MIDLSKAKKHLNIEPEFTEDDKYIRDLVDVSYEVVQKHINNNLNNFVDEVTGELPSPIEHAMLLMVGNLYQNREIATFANATKLPYSYDYLLDFYKNYYK